MKPYIKKFIPKVWLKYYLEQKNKNKSAETIFTEIYKKAYWGKTEHTPYFSGTGTHDVNTAEYIEMLNQFFKEKNINSVFEIGCGDFSIMKQVLAQRNVSYLGADIVADLVAHLQTTFGNEQTQFIHFDAITSKSYPNADLCIIRQVLQHLSNAQIQQILQKTKQYKYVIVTEHVPVNPQLINDDKNVNGYIRLQNSQISGVFLDAQPFSLNCKTILSYAKDDEDSNGKIAPALMVSSLIVND